MPSWLCPLAVPKGGVGWDSQPQPPVTVQMPAPPTAIPSPGRGEGMVPVAVSLGALSTKKAKSLDLHVPSLRQRPPGACGQVTGLRAAPTRLAAGKA